MIESRGVYAVAEYEAVKKEQGETHDFTRTQAALTLLRELDKGRQSGEEKGWFTLEEVEESLGLSHE